MLKATLIAGARPNFIKIAALENAFSSSGRFQNQLIHTGQHYDARMSDIFFRQLSMPEPDVYLGVGSGTHAQQTARVMTEVESVFLESRPDVVVVVGDVNSTVASALTARKLHIPLVHVEAGLRSFDRKMPEEINRIVTDSISDYLYVSEPTGLEHLLAEGHDPERCIFAGNVMIDSLRRFEEAAHQTLEHEKRGLESGEYFLITAHRPALVDHAEHLAIFADALLHLAEMGPVIFPIHPRTALMLDDIQHGKELKSHHNVHLSEPIGYLEFMCLMMHSGLVVTDSGGIQEETTALRKPCATVRPNTERPATITEGTNELIPLDVGRIADAGRRALAGEWKEGRIPELWDGKASERIAAHLADALS